MHANVKIKGLAKAESAAKEILEHVEAIKKLQQGASWAGLTVEVETLDWYLGDRISTDDYHQLVGATLERINELKATGQ